MSVEIVVQVKLIPEADQAAALSATLHTVNEAANWVSSVALERGVPREYELRKHTYAVLRSWGLGAQVAQHVIKKVRDAYTALKANVKAGHLGKPGSKGGRKAETKPIVFRAEAAQPYDDRCLSWHYDTQTVSIWTIAGRLKNVRFACSAGALKTLREHRQGESDLIEGDGVFYLYATCEVPEAEQYEPNGFIGVDLGVVNIATTSTGYKAAGRGLNRHRKRQLDLRRKLQRKGTKSAKRLLKKRNRRERRHVANTNHIISKTIVIEAERTSAGISLEELKGIRQRVRLRKPQRVALHSWAFAQLGDFIVYKARRAGVPVVFVDPAYTSQQCSECGHVDKRNRVDQGLFICRNCGVVAHADRNASHNIARKGEAVWTAGRESRVPATP
ncbi:RNA-guided endonuclease InsQ/TnpB family protein [Actinopolymorpha pittospori]|uniref:IS605 OrfB family transposase n=1 Tax=Actinopolymorpha pittospori TaxID=648752 RepID=A0A927MUF3_9ACTN|nr:RNA-guided endonuclease TnpB family protein [Actinopolymorpha pittospori]MBE1605453.1 IS605 OrfB family transposase [Actinopolymorpha pittospori]